MKITSELKKQYPLYKVFPIQPKCVKGNHKIILEEPKGRVSKGTCKKCGNEGMYPNTSYANLPWIV